MPGVALPIAVAAKVKSVAVDTLGAKADMVAHDPLWTALEGSNGATMPSVAVSVHGAVCTAPVEYVHVVVGAANDTNAGAHESSDPPLTGAAGSTVPAVDTAGKGGAATIEMAMAAATLIESRIK